MKDEQEVSSQQMKEHLKQFTSRAGLIDNDPSAQLYAGFTSFFLLVTVSRVRGTSRKCTASG